MAMVKEYFINCEEKFPEDTVTLRRLSLSIRREGILTMEELCRLQREHPEEITKLRNIGEKSARLVTIVCELYEKEKNSFFE